MQFLSAGNQSPLFRIIGTYLMPGQYCKIRLKIILQHNMSRLRYKMFLTTENTSTRKAEIYTCQVTSIVCFDKSETVFCSFSPGSDHSKIILLLFLLAGPFKLVFNLSLYCILVNLLYFYSFIFVLTSYFYLLLFLLTYLFVLSKIWPSSVASDKSMFLHCKII